MSHPSYNNLIPMSAVVDPTRLKILQMIHSCGVNFIPVKWFEIDLVKMPNWTIISVGLTNLKTIASLIPKNAKFTWEVAAKYKRYNPLLDCDISSWNNSATVLSINGVPVLSTSKQPEGVLYLDKASNAKYKLIVEVKQPFYKSKTETSILYKALYNKTSDQNLLAFFTPIHETFAYLEHLIKEIDPFSNKLYVLSPWTLIPRSYETKSKSDRKRAQKKARVAHVKLMTPSHPSNPKTPIINPSWFLDEGINPVDLEIEKLYDLRSFSNEQ